MVLFCGNGYSIENYKCCEFLERKVPGEDFTETRSWPKSGLKDVHASRPGVLGQGFGTRERPTKA